MTAINVLVQNDAAFMATDGSSYLPDGKLLEVDARKAVTFLRGRAALACTGPALLGEYIAKHLDDEFDTFDALVSGGEKRIGDLFREYVDEHRNGDAVATLFLIGWREANDEPAAYGIDMQTEGERAEAVKADNPHIKNVEDFKLQRLEIGGVPNAPIERLREAHYDLASNIKTVDAATDLLHMLEIQRSLAFNGKHYVGGRATLTRVDRDGVTQRVLRIWPDQVDDIIRPEPLPVDGSNFERWTKQSLSGRPT